MHPQHCAEFEEQISLESIIFFPISGEIDELTRALSRHEWNFSSTTQKISTLESSGKRKFTAGSFATAFICCPGLRDRHKVHAQGVELYKVITVTLSRGSSRPNGFCENHPCATLHIRERPFEAF